MKFKDHFSERAALYAAYRPLYPAALFEFLASLPARHRIALDCGTGNGQAAMGLAAYFDRVVATDPSATQLDNATRMRNIEYQVASAESSGLPAKSVDLVTAAQALHWFDSRSFFQEATRVLAADGAIAVWGYGDPILDSSALEETMHRFNRGTLERYWYPERQLLLDGYKNVPFPFDEIPAPEFELEMQWNLGELTGYLRTWSATARYLAERGIDPVIEVEKSLTADWGDPEIARVIRWPLCVRAGRTPKI